MFVSVFQCQVPSMSVSYQCSVSYFLFYFLLLSLIRFTCFLLPTLQCVCVWVAVCPSAEPCQVILCPCLSVSLYLIDFITFLCWILFCFQFWIYVLDFISLKNGLLSFFLSALQLGPHFCAHHTITSSSKLVLIQCQVKYFARFTNIKTNIERFLCMQTQQQRSKECSSQKSITSFLSVLLYADLVLKHLQFLTSTFHHPFNAKCFIFHAYSFSDNQKKNLKCWTQQIS